ncbi:hypothetical protein TKV_c09410 [Thermoanaerobacter kivui]|uniref:Uncharacterized protein n=1 Tax=Thermoanaerobacter kivui TaxID=2325 RepID=A0A097AQN6_THEKI|nr:hypothetical protein [Thermoanaerobacter kivui]AIS52120.1 hypothetical protein TKV_c09410 [Thermoanaerobacter kivui]
MKKLIAIIIASIFLFNFILVPAQSDTFSDFDKAKKEEQKLVLELLNLEVERLKTQKSLENLAVEIVNKFSKYRRYKNWRPVASKNSLWL